MAVETLPETQPSTAPDFGALATDEVIERTVEALRERQFEVHVAHDAAEAKDLILAALPPAGNVHRGASLTLDKLGFDAAVEERKTWTAIRPLLRTMNRETQGAEMRRMAASPDVIVGSVAAITEQGQILAGSKTGSQLAGYAYGAGKVVFVVGTQKIVPDLAAAWQRINEYVLPHEHERMQNAYGMDSALNKVLLINGDNPGRITVILVKESIGD
jgi:L-lactate utilization protein LutC